MSVLKIHHFSVISIYQSILFFLTSSVTQLFCPTSHFQRFYTKTYRVKFKNRLIRVLTVLQAIWICLIKYTEKSCIHYSSIVCRTVYYLLQVKWLFLITTQLKCFENLTVICCFAICCLNGNSVTVRCIFL